eukprot:scaffold75950_cov56-Phaeocystis_antarctica.AAC.1
MQLRSCCQATRSCCSMPSPARTAAAMAARRPTMYERAKARCTPLSIASPPPPPPLAPPLPPLPPLLPLFGAATALVTLSSLAPPLPPLPPLPLLPPLPPLPPLPLRYATSRGGTRSDISPAASSAPMLHASATSRSRSSKRVRWLVMLTRTTSWPLMRVVDGAAMPRS